jgi:hypothetical protein
MASRDRRSASFQQHSRLNFSSDIQCRIRSAHVASEEWRVWSIPGTCTVGELYFATDATAGQNIYQCAATNTWTQQLNSGGATLTVFDRYAQYGGSGVAQTANTTKCSAAIIGTSITFSKIGIRIVTLDGGNNSDVGLYNSSGTRVAHVGAQAMGSSGFLGLSTVEGSQTIAAGKYFFCATSAGSTLSVGVVAGTSVMSTLLVTSISTGGTTSGGALNGSFTAQADAAATGNVYAFILY